MHQASRLSNKQSTAADTHADSSQITISVLIKLALILFALLCVGVPCFALCCLALPCFALLCLALSCVVSRCFALVWLCLLLLIVDCLIHLCDTVFFCSIFKTKWEKTFSQMKTKQAGDLETSLCLHFPIRGLPRSISLLISHKRGGRMRPSLPRVKSDAHSTLTHSPQSWKQTVGGCEQRVLTLHVHVSKN